MKIAVDHVTKLRKRFRLALLSFTLIFTLAAGIVGYGIIQRHFVEDRAEAADVVGDMAEIAAGQVLNWKAERTAEADFLSRSPLIVKQIAKLAAHPDDLESGQDIGTALRLMKRGKRYTVLSLYQTNLQPFPTIENAPMLDSAASGLLTQALAQRRILFGPPRALARGGIVLDIAVPVFANRSDSDPIAAAWMQVDTRAVFTSMLHSSRSSSRSLETLVIQHDGNRTIYLSEPRFRVEQPMSIVLPEASERDELMNGPSIVYDGRDYRGEPVVAGLRGITGTPWMVVTKVDQEEIYSSLRGRVALIAAVFAFFILAQALGVGLVWHTKEANFLTQRLQEEKEHRGAFERLALLMSSTNDAVLVTNDRGQIVEVNEAASELYGYSKEDFQAKTVSDLCPSHTDEFPDGNAISEEEHSDKNGTAFPVEVSGRTVEWEGMPYRIHVIRDIRLRKLAEQQLQDTIASLEKAMEAVQTSEQRFRSFVEASSLTVWRADKYGDVFEVAVPHCSETGADTDKARGRQWLSLIHPEDRPQAESKWGAAIRSRQPLGIEVRRLSATGEYRYLEVRAVPIIGHDGEVIEWLGASRDIHEQKKAEQFLLQSQKMEALGNIAGGIAHDFNNILRAIAGNVRLASENLPERHPSRKTLTQVEQSCYRAFHLVQQILTFSRESELRMRPIDLGNIVEEALSLLRPTIPSSIELQVIIEPRLPYVSGDASQVHQAFLNLMANAVQAMEPVGGRLEVELATRHIETENQTEKLSPGAYVRLSISDSGPGIDLSTQKRIFEPFFTTKPQGQGTGLGLSVVHGVMATHGGIVDVESQQGQGATFNLYFPATEEVPKPIAKKPATKSVHTGAKVLFVDDDETLVRLATRTLPRKGFEVIGSSSPDTALGIFESTPYDFDAVVTDISMPSMSGFELASKLLRIRSDIPIIALSGFIRNEDAAEAMRIGIRKVLLKTLGDDELVEVLLEITKRREAIPA